MIEKIKQIALHAGEMMLDGFDKITVKTDVSNIVTNKDIEVQEYIVRECMGILPTSTFIAEEDEDYQEQDGFQWVINPIDGTTNFAYDYHHSAVSIGLLKDHEVIIGVCYNPYLKEMFYAEKGKGAYLNEKQVQVTNQSLSQALVLCGTSPYYKENCDKTFSRMKKIFLASRDIRRGGSAVLDLCYIAAGRADAYYEEVLAPWDYAAASLILQEAGGYIEVINGTWGFHAPLGMIAGNRSIVKEVSEFILE